MGQAGGCGVTGVFGRRLFTAVRDGSFQCFAFEMERVVPAKSGMAGGVGMAEGSEY